MTDYEHIVISAERYALGKMTYIVELTVNYILQEIEEENTILKKASNIAKEVNIEDITDVINESCKEFMSNYIPKQAVIDKIKELDIAILECEYDDDDVEEYKNDVEKEKRILLIKKSALEELLEEK